MAAESTTSTPGRPMLGADRRTGAFVALVPSSSQANVYHIVTTDGRCTCKGFQYRGKCRHTAQPEPNPLRDGGAAHLAVKRAAGEWPSQAERQAANAATYRQIWGSDDGGDAA